MSTNLTPEIRALPLYIDGLHDGTDIGLVIALAALTAERDHQEALADLRRVPGSPNAARQTYAAGCLHGVTKTLARRFRTIQPTEGEAS